MRLILLFTMIFILQLTLADTYYNADTCGISTINTARRRRSMRYKREIKKEDKEDDDEDEEEEEVEEEEEEQTENPSHNSTTPEPYGNYDDEEEGTDGKVADESMTEKVMGGTDAKLGELPWAVMLKIPLGSSKKKYSICGGTLISNRHVITAAHCFKLGDEKSGCMGADMMSDQEIVDKTQVFVGGVCRKLKPKEKAAECPEHERGEERRIRRVAFKRPFFDDKCSKSMWDVTLLELDYEIDGPHACLPHLHNMDQFNAMHTSMISFGFGANPLEGIKHNRRLQKVDLGTALDADDCRRLWHLPFNNFICTRETPTKNVCMGDSGGGILAKYNNRYFIVGIISFGSSCDNAAQNGRVQNAQVNMDINLYTATIDKYIEKQTPNYHDLWKDSK